MSTYTISTHFLHPPSVEKCHCVAGVGRDRERRGGRAPHPHRPRPSGDSAGAETNTFAHAPKMVEEKWDIAYVRNLWLGLQVEQAEQKNGLYALRCASDVNDGICACSSSLRCRCNRALRRGEQADQAALLDGRERDLRLREEHRSSAGARGGGPRGEHTGLERTLEAEDVPSL